jgi:hypothetical protein
MAAFQCRCDAGRARPRNLRRLIEVYMQTLIVEPNIARPDDFYEALIDMHRDLADAESQMANAALILLLANHIGDLRILREAIAAARAGVKST